MNKEQLIEDTAKILCKYRDCCNWKHCVVDGDVAHECTSVGIAKQILLGHGLYLRVTKSGRTEGDNYNDPTDSLYEFIPLEVE